MKCIDPFVTGYERGMFEERSARTESSPRQSIKNSEDDSRANNNIRETLGILSVTEWHLPKVVVQHVTQAMCGATTAKRWVTLPTNALCPTVENKNREHWDAPAESRKVKPERAGSPFHRLQRPRTMFPSRGLSWTTGPRRSICSVTRTY